MKAQLKGKIFILENYNEGREECLIKSFVDERTGIEYNLNGDYYILNLIIPKQKKINLNKYGRMRLNYLKEYKKSECTIIFMENILINHLEKIQEIAIIRANQIIEELKLKVI